MKLQASIWTDALVAVLCGIGFALRLISIWILNYS